MTWISSSPALMLRLLGTTAAFWRPSGEPRFQVSDFSRAAADRRRTVDAALVLSPGAPTPRRRLAASILVIIAALRPRPPVEMSPPSRRVRAITVTLASSSPEVSATALIRFESRAIHICNKCKRRPQRHLQFLQLGSRGCCGPGGRCQRAASRVCALEGPMEAPVMCSRLHPDGLRCLMGRLPIGPFTHRDGDEVRSDHDLDELFTPGYLLGRRRRGLLGARSPRALTFVARSPGRLSHRGAWRGCRGAALHSGERQCARFGGA
jgi:hypothetical protein